MRAEKKPTAGQETDEPAADAGGSPTLAKAEMRAFRKRLGGSESDDFNGVILRETLATVWVPGDEPDGQNRRIRATAAALAGFKPKDEIEGMLAAQAVAMHFGAMECFRRAMIPEQSGDVANKLRRDGANLARGVTDMLDALDRKRGKRPQVVRVERVVVQEGGRAIVGNVQAGADPAPVAPEPCPAIEHEAPGPTLDVAAVGRRAAAPVPEGGRDDV